MASPTSDILENTQSLFIPTSNILENTQSLFIKNEDSKNEREKKSGAIVVVVDYNLEDLKDFKERRNLRG